LTKLVLLSFVDASASFALGAAARPSLRSRAAAPPQLSAAGIGGLSTLQQTTFAVADTVFRNIVERGDTTYVDTTVGGIDGTLVIFFLAVGFPTALILFVYKDYKPTPPVEEIPKGWQKVPSASRPGKFSYLNTRTKERYDRLPREAWKDV